MSVDMSSFLMGGSGAGAPSLKFNPKDKTAHTLTVSEEPELRQQTEYKADGTQGPPKHFANGDPMMQLVVTGTVDASESEGAEDDLRRRLYVKGELQKAVGQAVAEAGVKEIKVGGKLWVQCTGTVKTKSGYDAYSYTAKYKAPEVSNSAAASFLGDANGPGDAPPFATAFNRPSAYLRDPGDWVEAV